MVLSEDPVESVQGRSSVRWCVSAVVCITSFGKDFRGLSGRLLRNLMPSGPAQHPLERIPSSLVCQRHWMAPVTRVPYCLLPCAPVLELRPCSQRPPLASPRGPSTDPSAVGRVLGMVICPPQGDFSPCSNIWNSFNRAHLLSRLAWRYSSDRAVLPRITP